MADDPKSIL